MKRALPLFLVFAAPMAACTTVTEPPPARAPDTAVHFVVAGGDDAVLALGNAGTFLDYGREAIRRFATRGPGATMAIGLTLHPRRPAAPPLRCTEDADCGDGGRCSRTVETLVLRACSDENGVHECSVPSRGVGRCPGTEALCTRTEEMVVDHALRAVGCEGCSFAPFCLPRSRCASADYAVPDVALGPAATTRDAVDAAFADFTTGGNGALDGAYEAALAHVTAYAETHPHTRVAVVVIGTDARAGMCGDADVPFAYAARAAKAGNAHVQTFAITLDPNTTTKLGVNLRVLGRLSAEKTLPERFDDALAEVANALRAPR